jgi:hypothetical protein
MRTDNQKVPRDMSACFSNFLNWVMRESSPNMESILKPIPAPLCCGAWLE